jgi:hypothetical protein
MGQCNDGIGSHLKKVFWPNLGVGGEFQNLDIPMYACGLKLASILILNQNPFFKMASSVMTRDESQTERRG